MRHIFWIHGKLSLIGLKILFASYSISLTLGKICVKMLFCIKVYQARSIIIIINYAFTFVKKRHWYKRHVETIKIWEKHVQLRRPGQIKAIKTSIQGCKLVCHRFKFSRVNVLNPISWETKGPPTKKIISFIRKVCHVRNKWAKKGKFLIFVSSVVQWKKKSEPNTTTCQSKVRYWFSLVEYGRLFRIKHTSYAFFILEKRRSKPVLTRSSETLLRRALS